MWVWRSQSTVPDPRLASPGRLDGHSTANASAAQERIRAGSEFRQRQLGMGFRTLRPAGEDSERR